MTLLFCGEKIESIEKLETPEANFYKITIEVVKGSELDLALERALLESEVNNVR